MGHVGPGRLESRCVTLRHRLRRADSSCRIGSQRWPRSSSRSAPAARAGCPPRLRVEVALAMLGDVLEAARRASATGAPRDRRRGRRARGGRTRRRGRRRSRAAARVRRSEPRSPVSTAPASSSTPMCPASARGLLALAIPPRRRRRARRAPPDGTTNALGLPFAEVFQPLYGPASAAQFRAHARRSGSSSRSRPAEPRDDVDTRADLDRIGARGGPPHAGARSASRREGRAALGRRRRREARGRPPRRAGAGRADDDRQRRRRPRGARPARLARSRLGPLRASPV